MTNKELSKFLKYLDNCGLLKPPHDAFDYEKVIWRYQQKLTEVCLCKCGVASEHFMCEKCWEMEIKKLTTGDGKN
jgi:hypothetical protein